jgi:uncharacterized membrane protein
MLAGILHLAVPDKFLLIIPDWVPLPYETVPALTPRQEFALPVSSSVTRRASRVAG